MTDRETKIVILTYFFAGLLVFGLLCVLCSYTAWFRSGSTAAERRSFVQTINPRAAVSEKETSEKDQLLGGQRV
jgi:hypothetical protein